MERQVGLLAQLAEERAAAARSTEETLKQLQAEAGVSCVCSCAFAMHAVASVVGVCLWCGGVCGVGGRRVVCVRVWQCVVVWCRVPCVWVRVVGLAGVSLV